MGLTAAAGPREKNYSAMLACQEERESLDKPGMMDLSTISLSSRQARRRSPSPSPSSCHMARCHAPLPVFCLAVSRNVSISHEITLGGAWGRQLEDRKQGPTDMSSMLDQFI